MSDKATENETNPTAGTAEDFIGKPEIARRLNKTVRTVDNWMKRGILPYYKLGHSVVFRWSEVESYLHANCRVSFRRGA